MFVINPLIVIIYLIFSNIIFFLYMYRCIMSGFYLWNFQRAATLLSQVTFERDSETISKVLGSNHGRITTNTYPL